MKFRINSGLSPICLRPPAYHDSTIWTPGYGLNMSPIVCLVNKIAQCNLTKYMLFTVMKMAHQSKSGKYHQNLEFTQHTHTSILAGLTKAAPATFKMSILKLESGIHNQSGNPSSLTVCIQHHQNLDMSHNVHTHIALQSLPS